MNVSQNLLKNQLCMAFRPFVRYKKKDFQLVVRKLPEVRVPIVTDTNKLVNYVCNSNLLEEGEDVKIKPDSEYPDWLWDIHIGEPLTLEEMNPDSKAYWNKVKKIGQKKEKYLLSLQKHKTVQK